MTTARTLLFTCFLSTLPVGLLAGEEPTQFLRFVDEGDSRGRLETAIVKYRDAHGAEVDLIAAVHIADSAYYRKLDRHFATYDALLYEMIKPKDAVPKRGERGGSLLSAFQRGLTEVLDLDFQLDGIDYEKKNFVHADMDPDTFFRTQREKGESIVSLMLKSMRQQWKLQKEGKLRQPTLIDLIRAFSSRDSSRALKYLFAKQLEDMEALLAGIEGEEGSVIVAERNKVAIGVLRRELAAGKKKLGIFYGAAHMSDMEKRLDKLGFKKAKSRWVLAWDVGSRGQQDASTKDAPKPAPRRRRI